MTDGHLGPFDATSTLGWAVPIAAMLFAAEIPAFGVWTLMVRELGQPAPEVVARMAGMFALVAGVAIGSLPLSTRLSPVLKMLSSVVLGLAAARLFWIATIYTVS